jgi:hypothetical protein
MFGHRSKQIKDFITFLAPRSGRQITAQALYTQVVANYELPGAVCDCILAVSEAARTLHGVSQNSDSRNMIAAIQGFAMEFLQDCFPHEATGSSHTTGYLAGRIFDRMFPSPNPSKSFFQRSLESEVIAFLSDLNDTFRNTISSGYTFDQAKAEKVFISFGIGVEKTLGSYLEQSMYMAPMNNLAYGFSTVSVSDWR